MDDTDSFTDIARHVDDTVSLTMADMSMTQTVLVAVSGTLLVRTEFC